MSEDLEVDPVKMRQSAGGINTAGNTLQSNFAGFQQEMESDANEVFGDDDLGSLIGGVYQAIHEVAFGSYNDNAGAMKDHVQNVHAMAAGYESSEQANTGEVNDVRSILG
jgi:hypothetical protein